MSSDAESADSMSPDLVFEILSNTRRRMVLYYLRQNDGMATVKELAEQIAALENDVDIADLRRQQRKRAYVSLYQTHLPKLADAGIIEYDDAEGEVRLTDRAGEFDSYLTSTEESGYPWRIHYLVLAGLGGWLFALSVLGTPGLAAVPSAWFGFALLGSFVVSAGVQYWKRRQQLSEVPAELLQDD